MDNGNVVMRWQPADQLILPFYEMLRVSAGPRALRMSDSDPGNLDKGLQGVRPRARSGGYDRSRRDRACIQPASLRLNVQRARAPSRGRERSPQGALHAAAMLE